MLYWGFRYSSICAIRDITVVVKKLLKIQQCYLATIDSYKTAYSKTQTGLRKIAHNAFHTYSEIFSPIWLGLLAYPVPLNLALHAMVHFK